jgi:hypothetical protein
MTRRRRILLLAIFVIAIGVFIALALRQPAEPTFSGRSLSEWVRDISPTMLSSGMRVARPVIVPRLQRATNLNGRIAMRSVFMTNPPAFFLPATWMSTFQTDPRHQAAAQAIRGIGTNAVPHLLTTIYAHDGKAKETIAKWWRKQRWVKLPFETAVEKKQRALPALRELGPAVVWTWVEILTNDLASAEVQQYAAASLAGMRAQATPALATLFELQDHTNLVLRTSIGAAIQYCDTEGFLSALYNLRHSINPDVRASAAWSLGYIGKYSDRSIPALAVALKDGSARVRESAVESLGKFGTNAPGITELILPSLNDPERRVRKAATNAMQRFEADANAGYKATDSL